MTGLGLGGGAFFFGAGAAAFGLGVGLGTGDGLSLVASGDGEPSEAAGTAAGDGKLATGFGSPRRPKNAATPTRVTTVTTTAPATTRLRGFDRRATASDPTGARPGTWSPRPTGEDGNHAHAYRPA